VRQRLPGRIADVSIDANDGFPEHVCEKCKRRLEHLEKAAEDLESFRAQVRASYASLRLKRSELKRSKDTSSIDSFLLVIGFSGSIGLGTDSPIGRFGSFRYAVTIISGESGSVSESLECSSNSNTGKATKIDSHTGLDSLEAS